MLPPSASSEGFLLPQAGLVLRPAGEEWVLFDSQGLVQGRFSADLAEALLGRLSGAAPQPLLAALERTAPGLAQALSEEALPLGPAALLRRGGWGQLFVELTARCNERCVHCYASSTPERLEALDPATVDAVLREAAELEFQVVQFTGGEALLCPFLADAARRATELGIPTVEIYTNGVLLDERRYAQLRELGVAFAISLYARDPQVHDAVTNLPGSHRRTVAAIRRAVAGGSPLRVSALMTRPGDEAQAHGAVELAAELGVPREQISLGGTAAVGRGQLLEAGDPPGSVRHTLVEGGKAAVLPEGWVTPCIFSRELRLGRVGPEGGLKAALLQPAAVLRQAACAADVSEALRAGCAQLACAGCRVATALLRPSPEPSPA